MKHTKQLLLSLLIASLFSSPATPQVTWDTLSTKFDGQFAGVESFYVDPEDSTLICLGWIQQVNGITINGIVGIKKDQSLKIYPPLPVVTQCAIRWNGDLYVGGTSQLVKWTGNSWQVLCNNCQPMCFYPYQGKLLIGGRFWNGIGNLGAGSLYAFDGINFTLPFGVDTFINTANSDVYSIQEYQNELYIGGRIGGYVNPFSRNIVRWTGNNWKNVGNGLSGYGGYQLVADMAVMNNELFVGGRFDEATGSPGNNIVKWNGTSFSKLGTGVNRMGGVNDLDVLGNTLLVAGFFDSVNNQLGFGYAAYCSGVWCPNTDSPNNSVSCVANYYGKIIVGGGFTNLAQDSFYRIAEVVSHGNCLPAANVENNNAQFEVKVFPNPTLGELIIQLPQNINASSLKLYSVDGKLALFQTLHAQSNSIHLNPLSSGIYYYTIENNKQLLSRGKLVKE